MLSFEGVSVVIPSYNYGRFVREAVQSVLTQTYSTIEVIVVDDGSTDLTRSIVGRISDSRLRYIYQNNRGLSAARNTGIQNARYPFIAFLDADDLMLPRRLEIAMGQFAKLPAGYGLVACGSARMTEQGAVFDRKISCDFLERDYVPTDLVLKSRFMPSAVVVRANVFDQVGEFDVSLRSSEDRDMWIRIATKFRLRYRAEPLVLIRKHGNNMSKNADRMRINMRKVIGNYFSGGIRNPAELVSYFRSISFNYFEVAWMYYDEGRNSEAIRMMFMSLLCWPAFTKPQYNLGQPFLFRIRGLIRFLIRDGATN